MSIYSTLSKSNQNAPDGTTNGNALPEKSTIDVAELEAIARSTAKNDEHTQYAQADSEPQFETVKFNDNTERKKWD